MWFENDLFCQVNFWFACWLLDEYELGVDVFLVREDGKTSYGFAGMNEEQLATAYQNRMLLNRQDRGVLAHLWNLYRAGQGQAILDELKAGSPKFSFIIPAAEANAQRFPEDGSLGRPQQTLLNIKEELQTEDFRPVFQEFCKRESVYGFGDLQVKRLWDAL